MVKRMLIDATHPEETRVVVVSGTKLDEFDFETSTKKQLKGSIYLAKVIRIEPSLQAAFVDYGGNRHGFLAFSEIHPDYYQIPVADREALLAEQERRARQSEEAENNGGRRWRRRPNDRNRRPQESNDGADGQPQAAGETAGETALAESDAHDVLLDHGSNDLEAMPSTPVGEDSGASIETVGEWSEERPDRGGDYREEEHNEDQLNRSGESEKTENRHLGADFERPELRDTIQSPSFSDERDQPAPALTGDEDQGDRPPLQVVHEEGAPETFDDALPHAAAMSPDNGGQPPSPDVETPGTAAEIAAPEPDTNVETLGGDDLGEEERPRRAQSLRNYKIQEVIKRRQILLVQVVKEERGNKGAALTTYLSLAGRYCVLMPNAGRGGGISRKISNPADRKRLKEMLSELEVPNGMGVILRTAGLERTKAEIKRDYDYLMRLWDTIREVTLKSTAPALIYEEGNLIKRSIRDLYSKDIEDILIEGEEGYRAAKDFMRQLMPSHAKKVQLYNDQTPLFHRYQVETQLDAMHSPVVQLRSGGYIVINPTEALVAIDVNSGRATKERNIEETALRTNAEAAEEIARQLRLRDLAGLIVIDFIDMEDQRHQQQVERRLKEAMRSDRARIQIGRISAFGLLELSRQRLRPSLLEISTEVCPHCEGTGRVRSTESTVLHVLRGIEEEGIRRRAAEIRVAVPTAVALYLLNQKRSALAEMEQRYAFRVFVDGDESLIPPHYKLERIRTRPADQAPVPLSMTSTPYDAEPAIDEIDEVEDDAAETASDVGQGASPANAAEGSEESDQDRNRRRRRRRPRRRPEDGQVTQGEIPGMGDQPPVQGHDMVPEAGLSQAADDDSEDNHTEGETITPENAVAGEDSEANRRRRRRGRRGGRRRRHGDGNAVPGNGADHQRGPRSYDGDQSGAIQANPTFSRQDDGHRPVDVPSVVSPPPSHVAPAAGEHERAPHQSDDAPRPGDSDPPIALTPTPSHQDVAEEAAPSGPARKGWWQRLTTRE